jgi:hypothetical protein
MTVLAQTLSDDTRIISGLRNNPLFSDAQIVELLNDALSEQRDKFIAAMSHWFRKTAPFTLVGNVSGSNTFDLTTIPDFQMDQGVNWIPATGARPITVPRLGSFAERNAIGGGVGWLTGQRREYFTNGDLLFIDPFTNSAGSYELIYTPQATPLAIPEPPPPAVAGTPAAITSIGTAGQYDFSGALFTAANIGDSLVVTGAANAANNGSFPIAAVPNPNAIVVTNPASVNEGAGATAAVQPAGTRADLPATLTPWAVYLKVHAAISIQTSRRQQIGPELSAKLAVESARLTAMAKKRSEGPQQAPITRRRRWGGISYTGG